MSIVAFLIRETVHEEESKILSCSTDFDNLNNLNNNLNLEKTLQRNYVC